ncbi:hypothetical protein [Microbacter margulisiae]|uniref:Transmembrane protein n=1 Tax=Microbacter margulisiae TaxID=1350067 RepID=A0A7W5H2H0_9PORP|nr:hypothetical protein [Microbacter margulisiae]MBB3188673.1 hypothetical protein [Microbacter margulisiae]
MRIDKRHLLFVAAMAWLVASGMLFWRSTTYFELRKGWKLETAASLVGGILFFRVLFLRISSKHIKRIISLEKRKPSVFSFFSKRSYLLMAIMISGGVLLRESHILPTYDLSFFYFFMGTPLFLSSIRFFKAWVRYPIEVLDVEN